MLARTAAALLAAATLLLAAAPADAAQLTPRSRVTTNGLGPVEVGMTVRAAERAAGMRLVALPGGERSCSYVRPEDRRVRAELMVVRGRIVRVDVRRRGIATRSGIRVGDAEAEVRRAFRGRLRIGPHKYVPGGRYLEVVPADRAERNRRVLFETDGREVTYVRAGRLPEVLWVEGCS